MIELKDVSFQYENSDKESVSHINIFVEGRVYSSMRQKWMWKNNSDEADQWVNPSYGKRKKRRFCIHKRCVCG